MGKAFEINGRKYTSAPFDMNTIADLDEFGVSIENMGTRVYAGIRAYFAICSGLDLRDAGNELQAHIVNGGDMDELVTAMNYEQENSDFFRSIKERQTESNPESQEEETEETPKGKGKTSTKAKATSR